MMVNYHIYQLKAIAIALTLGGGFIDAYTFMEKGGTLAAGQTGNLVFFGIDMARHNLPGIWTKLLTFLAFIIGLSLTTVIAEKGKLKYWRAWALCPLTVLCVIVGCIPDNVPNAFVVPLLSFGMAMQNVAFDKIEGEGYNNIFATGNLKIAVIQLTKYYLTGDRKLRKSGINFLYLVVGFAIGACLAAICDQYFHQKTIWIASLYLMIVNAFYMRSAFKKQSHPSST